MKKRYFFKIIFAISLGIFAGIQAGEDGAIFGIRFHSIFSLFGDLFLNALMLIVVPLIASSIITGISKIGEKRSFSKVGMKTFSIFLLTNLLGIVVGVVLVNLFKGPFLKSAASLTSIKGPIEFADPQKSNMIREIILQIIPKNIVEAISSGQMLGIIFFSILFGYAVTKIKKNLSMQIKNIFEALFNTMIYITGLIMKFLPIGVFFLVAKEFSQKGLATVKILGFFSSLTILGFSIHFFLIIPLILILIGRINPIKHLKAVFSALVTAFSTTSSAATLPVTINCLEKNSKIPNEICGLVAPLGTSLNLSATAFYVFIATSFISASHGIPLNLETQSMIFLLSLIATFGVAAVPSGAIIVIMIMLKTFGIPISSIGFFVVIDRFIDMFRTTTNVFGVSASTAVISKILKKDDA